MNKLIIDNVDELTDLIIHEDTELIIELKDSFGIINIDVMDNVCLYVLYIGNNTKNKVKYNLRENSKLIVNKLVVNTSDDIEINLGGINASVNYNTSIINDSNNSYREIINHDYSNTNSLISTHAINMNESNLVLDIDAKVGNDSLNCVTNQDNKIINKSCGKSEIKPNLLVDNNLIDATHSAFIGSFNPKIVFYLQTRGINLENIEKLLSRGFLLGNMNLNTQEKERFESIINDYIRGGEKIES